MARLVFKASLEDSLSQILKLVMPYMKGLVYEEICVLADGKSRIVMQRTNEGYLLYGAVLTPDKIKKRYF
ncbi:MAG TPA: hypothetical protein DDX39_00320 [Bacteroidales bacterium]|nr:MAG: hypothetical protein A2W98_03235 [Bacteroidetes bacterium GWF2_33_38]OFY91924.1 MAG: hypothetical protein A2236_01985 [Bacteroidetes bacterium RIFOXYA2_FULL_33_7]HBF87054.1 hypothetical protein [Bacteroidales bacterium]